MAFSGFYDSLLVIEVPILVIGQMYGLEVLWKEAGQGFCNGQNLHLGLALLECSTGNPEPNYNSYHCNSTSDRMRPIDIRLVIGLSHRANPTSI